LLESHFSGPEWPLRQTARLCIVKPLILIRFKGARWIAGISFPDLLQQKTIGILSMLRVGRLWKGPTEKSEGAGKRRRARKGKASPRSSMPWVAEGGGKSRREILRSGGVAAVPWGGTGRVFRATDPTAVWLLAWPKRELRRSNATVNKGRGQVTAQALGSPLVGDWSRNRGQGAERSRGADQTSRTGGWFDIATGRRSPKAPPFLV
jgi:hypothetical protein